MSHEAVQVVLEQTLSDETFRSRLFAHPEQTLASFDLTPGELTALRALCVDLDSGESLALDKRQSKRPLWLAGF